MKYLAIDFEYCDSKCTPLAYAIMISDYPSGKVLYHTFGACDRPMTDYDEVTLKFWHSHPDSHQFLLDRGRGILPATMQEQLVSNIDYISRTFSNVFVVTDNVQDISCLNSILGAHGMKTIFYLNGHYRQCLCTWSFALGRLGKGAREKIAHVKDTREVSEYYFGLKHTASSCCAKILSSHFKVMDMAHVPVCM